MKESISILLYDTETDVLQRVTFGDYGWVVYPFPGVSITSWACA